MAGKLGTCVGGEKEEFGEVRSCQPCLPQGLSSDFL